MIAPPSCITSCSFCFFLWSLAPLPRFPCPATAKIPAQRMLSQSLLSGEPSQGIHRFMKFQNPHWDHHSCDPSSPACSSALLQMSILRAACWIPENQHGEQLRDESQVHSYLAKRTKHDLSYRWQTWCSLSSPLSRCSQHCCMALTSLLIRLLLDIGPIHEGWE